jgi:hypothetical protein
MTIRIDNIVLAYLCGFGDLRGDPGETSLSHCLLVQTSLEELVKESCVILMLELGSVAYQQGTCGAMVP